MDSYWADEKDEQIFGQNLIARLKTCQEGDNEGLQNYLEQVRNAFYHYFGVNMTGPSASHMTRMGEQGEHAALRVNHLRSLAQARLQIICSPKLSWKGEAVNSSYDSQRSTVLSQHVLEYNWKTRNIDRLTLEAAERALYCGEHFMFTPWNPSLGESFAADGQKLVRTGDVDFISVPSWNVFRDTLSTSWDDLKWKVIRTYVNKWDLIALYPQCKEDIQAVGLGVELDGVKQSINTSWDLVGIYWFFHDRTDALPNGREALFLSNGKVLRQGALTYKRIPLHRMFISEWHGTPFAYTNFWEGGAVQELTDSYESTIATNATTFGNQIISAEQGQELQLDALGNGPAVILRPQGSQPPAALNLVSVPAPVFQHLGDLRQSLRQLMGLNDVALGQSPSAQMNAQAFAVLASAAVQANSIAQKNWISFVSSIGQSVIEQYQQRASVQRRISISGNATRSHQVMQFSGTDLQNVDRVYVEANSMLAQTVEGRLQLGQMMMDAGQIKRPEDLFSILDTGRLDVATEPETNQRLLITYENEKLADGLLDEIAVSAYDPHDRHLKCHSDLLSDPSVRMDPAKVQAILMHMDEHLNAWRMGDPDMLAAIGLPPLPSQMGPAGAPPSASPPTDAPPEMGTAPEQTPDQSNPESLPMPENPATGQEYDPATGGGVI